jgi:hypothetical protein
MTRGRAAYEVSLHGSPPDGPPPTTPPTRGTVCLVRELLHTAHFVLAVDDATRIVTRARTAERFASLEEVTREYDGLVRALDGIDRSVHAHLVDLRFAPSRNDDAFESLVTRYQGPLYDRFRRVAVVVATAAGRLQLRRFLTAFRPDGEIFTDIDEATVFLRG